MPQVSVIMPNYNGGAFLEAAISSVLRQKGPELEVIVSDDSSTDGSREIVRHMARQDTRVRLIEAEHNGGAASARNRALDQARGAWIAFMDGDDLIHPQRLERLITAANRHGARMVADDLSFISAVPAAAGRTLLEARMAKDPWWIGAQEMIVSGDPDGDVPKLGYLKMMIARETMGDLRYEETLSVAEDFDFYLRLLLRPERCLVLPEPMYLYRRHASSLSYRLSVEKVQAMLDAHDRLVARGQISRDQLAGLQRRRGALLLALDYERLVAAFKARRPFAMLRGLAARPSLAHKLAASLRERRVREHGKDGPRSALSLSIGAGVEDKTSPRAAALRVEAPPMAGQSWASPPAALAMELSRLAAVFDLDIHVEDDAGHWALGLTPAWRSLTVAPKR